MDNTNLFHGEFTQIAKLWKRAIANMADGFIVALPVMVIAIPCFFIFGKNLPNVIEQSAQIGNVESLVLFGGMFSMIYLGIAAVYYTYFIGKTGQTPGKKYMGLMVVSSSGGTVGYKKAFLRYLFFVIYGLEIIGGIIFAISAIMAITDKCRRSLHDRLCKTIVIGKGKEEAIEKVIQEGNPRISGPAIFALFLSIFCIVIPIVGQIICFFVCARVLHDIKQSKGLLKGKSLVIASVVICIITIIGYLFLIVK